VTLSWTGLVAAGSDTVDASVRFVSAPSSYVAVPTEVVDVTVHRADIGVVRVGRRRIGCGTAACDGSHVGGARQLSGSGHCRCCSCTLLPPLPPPLPPPSHLQVLSVPQGTTLPSSVEEDSASEVLVRLSSTPVGPVALSCALTGRGGSLGQAVQLDTSALDNVVTDQSLLVLLLRLPENNVVTVNGAVSVSCTAVYAAGPAAGVLAIAGASRAFALVDNDAPGACRSKAFVVT
jgi:hypothetical protein